MSGTAADRGFHGDKPVHSAILAAQVDCATRILFLQFTFRQNENFLPLEAVLVHARALVPFAIGHVAITFMVT